MPQVIPLVGGDVNANQSLSVTLGDFSVELEFHYQQSGQWMMHVIADGDVGEVPTTTINGVQYIAPGAMLEGGVDILQSWDIAKTFGQMFFVGDEATLSNLGADNKLVWYSPDEALSYG